MKSGVLLSLLFLVAGLAGLTGFVFFVWPPLALVPPSLAAVLAGLLVDWGSLRGEPSTTADRAG